MLIVNTVMFCLLLRQRNNTNVYVCVCVVKVVYKNLYIHILNILKKRIGMYISLNVCLLIYINV